MNSLSTQTEFNSIRDSVDRSKKVSLHSALKSFFPQATPICLREKVIRQGVAGSPMCDLHKIYILPNLIFPLSNFCLFCTRIMLI